MRKLALTLKCVVGLLVAWCMQKDQWLLIQKTCFGVLVLLLPSSVILIIDTPPPWAQFLIYKLLAMGLECCYIVPSSFNILRIKIAVHENWAKYLFLTYIVTKKNF